MDGNARAFPEYATEMRDRDLHFISYLLKRESSPKLFGNKLLAIFGKLIQDYSF